MSDKNVANRLTGSTVVKQQGAEGTSYHKPNFAVLTVGDLVDILKKLPRREMVFDAEGDVTLVEINSDGVHIL